MAFASQQRVSGTTTSVSTGYKTHLTPQASSLVVPGFDGPAPSTSISPSQGLITPGSALHVGSRGQSPQISRYHRRQAQDMMNFLVLIRYKTQRLLLVLVVTPSSHLQFMVLNLLLLIPKVFKLIHNSRDIKINLNLRYKDVNKSSQH